jgi:hypothetical protein
MALQSAVIEWDGIHLPTELRKLPPGRYFVEPIDDLADLTPEEEAGILEAIRQADAGEVVPFEEVARNIRARYPKE